MTVKDWLACAAVAGTLGWMAVRIQQEKNHVVTVIENGVAYDVWSLKLLPRTADALERDLKLREARKQGWELISSEYRPGKGGGWYVKLRRRQSTGQGE